MFTDSGCLTTLLPPLSLPSPFCFPLTPHSPLSPAHTHTDTHTCSRRLSVATLLLPLSNFFLSSHLLHTHARLHMHAHTHVYARTRCASSLLFCWQRPWRRHDLTPQEGSIKEWGGVLSGGGPLNTTIWPTTPCLSLWKKRERRDLCCINTRTTLQRAHKADDLWNRIQPRVFWCPRIAFAFSKLFSLCFSQKGDDISRHSRVTQGDNFWPASPHISLASSPLSLSVPPPPPTHTFLLCIHLEDKEFSCKYSRSLICERSWKKLFVSVFNVFPKFDGCLNLGSAVWI